MRRTKTFKASIALLVSLFTMMFVAACGDGSGNNSNGPVTVTVMTWESADTNKAIDAALQKFMQQNPNIKVERIATPNSDYGQKLSSLVVAKKLPDIFWAGNDTEQQYGGQGLLYDWTQYASKTDSNFDLSKFAPASIENWKNNGKLFGLPTLMNTYGVWYNADMFNKAGLPLPKAGWTYDEMLHDAQVLTQKEGGKVTRYGLWNPPSGPFETGYCSVSAGGQPFQDKILNATKVTAGPEFIDCAKKMASAVQNGSVTPPGYNVDSAQDAFASGKIPMFYNGQWFAPGFMQAKPTFKYGFAPYPVVKDRVQPYDAVGIVSPRYIKNPDAVWKVTQFLASSAWESVLPGAPVAPAAYVPASTPYFDALKSAGLQTVADAVNYELTTQNKQGIRFIAPWATKANDVVTAKWSDILNGKVPVDSGISDMVKQLNDVIQQNA
ncbi:MAG: sugar ABC transporter substrate-binding protein [Ktedonobacteraceae bacterium]|nr:sugar ABC transporter substrate-binding protein [Ktedonobacteraceae bacterium]MBO0789625.1 sugar ABC transporter substrate-binding protein [Ktedonobacteraceae bacterium]